MKLGLPATLKLSAAASVQKAPDFQQNSTLKITAVAELWLKQSKDVVSSTVI